MRIDVSSAGGGYGIELSRGAINRCGDMFDLDRRVLVVTDSGVPAEYAERVAAACGMPVTVTVESGEASKSLSGYEYLCGRMLEHGFTRTDCVVAVGGGVVGDLAGFAAATYMRGVDFYNIPTTVLSQVDSSVGGKTAIDFMGIKNVLGAFISPRGVIIDPDLLSTLPKRQIVNGLAESLKMALTSDAELFRMFESGEAENDIDTVILRSIRVKTGVVEEDEKESGVRRILNFGHTVGHGIESLGGLLHGECVALGMLPMCSPDVRSRLIEVEKRLGLPHELKGDPEKVISAMTHDKKKSGGDLTAVFVEAPGACVLRKIPFDELAQTVREAFGK